MFQKIVIANRGEIACRIAQVCREMGISTVAVYSSADATAPHVRACDEAVEIGPPRPAESYLDGAKIVEVARRTGAEAVHPGYGFLSENAAFARACADAGLVFVGPSPEAIEAMGDKARARSTMAAAGVPVVPGSAGVVSPEQAAAEAERIGYPVLVKAAAGGGGIGMAVAHNAEELGKAVQQCASRARAAFGDDALYLERYFEAPRHVEVQVLCDAHGHHLHLMERECSIQRRHQKVVEEAGSPLFLDGARRGLASAMYEAALRAARAIDYQGAGTLEFLVSGEDFYFIEMNTRLQVEHPCTEVTTGVDLIGWQLRIAAGEPLDLSQEAVRRQGHAIEMRIYAEDPDKRFFPSPGTIERYEVPEGEGIRVDSGVEAGYTVTPFYDPMIAKLIVHGETRAQAIERGLTALEGFVVEGIKTNIPLHRKVLASEAFRRGDLSTRFIQEHFQ
ncbi:MAG: acetyl-CoA carboxylase biotin carboxylase subunit [Deltaproteobacteria bacterium]|nr:MAG: acetyl-CoA carboxylase biotin carboxylase subunit [Deltaproteobacteria bacterium]